MDIAVVAKNAENRFALYVFKGNRTGIEARPEHMLYVNDSFNITSQPMLLDVNGDMISDLLLTEFNATTELSEYVVYLGGTSFTTQKFDSTRTEKEKINVKPFNSNAFIDLNKDNVSDIFLEGKI